MRPDELAERIRAAQEGAWEEGYDEPRECCGMCPRNACPWDNWGKGPVNPYAKGNNE